VSRITVTTERDFLAKKNRDYRWHIKTWPKENERSHEENKHIRRTTGKEPDIANSEETTGDAN
jgi:hypothetical protein